jgi:hypothetical protein
MTSLAFLFAAGWRPDPVPGFVPADWLLLGLCFLLVVVINLDIQR